MSDDKPASSAESSSDLSDRLVCFCHYVTERTIIETIRGGATTIAEIQAATRASTGCGGCEGDVLDILQEELRKKP